LRIGLAEAEYFSHVQPKGASEALDVIDLRVLELTLEDAVHGGLVKAGSLGQLCLAPAQLFAPCRQRGGDVTDRNSHAEIIPLRIMQSVLRLTIPMRIILLNA
jgi:hypothetical protein